MRVTLFSAPFRTKVTLEDGLAVLTVGCADVGLAVVVGPFEDDPVLPLVGTVVNWHRGS